jgi:5-deoxy-glucuronate isomerase
MNLFFKRPGAVGTTEIVNPRNSDSDGLELALIRPGPGTSVDAVSPGRESLLVILGGRCAITVGDAAAWEGLGGRDSVFDGAATSVYVPPGMPYRIATAGQAEIAVLRAPADAGGEPYVIRPSEVAVADRGGGAWHRTVHTILDDSRPARRLVVGETFNEPGAWSSYPPHKHDRHDPPREARFQEVYHFRLAPQAGFGIQRLYSPEAGVDSTFVVEDGDTVLIPFGYHPVVAAPGYRLYYLWALSGEGRRLMAREDPTHAWVGRTA